jgi:hypothetical protein
MALTIAERQARYRAKHKKPRRQAVTHNARNAQSVTGETERKLPLAHMLDVMNDETAAPARRDRMAVAAAAYVHPRVPRCGWKKGRQAGGGSSGERWPVCSRCAA